MLHDDVKIAMYNPNVNSVLIIFRWWDQRIWIVYLVEREKGFKRESSEILYNTYLITVFFVETMSSSLKILNTWIKPEPLEEAIARVSDFLEGWLKRN